MYISLASLIHSCRAHSCNDRLLTLGIVLYVFMGQVENGMAHWGYDSGHVDYSFVTQQSRVYLYLTARSSEANNIGKPSFKVYPEEGLSVQLDGTASNGLPPTTESPTILQIDWRCKFLFLYLCHMPSYIEN
jgi:hypothetical protein